jgi:hypothetical protein
LHSSYAGKKGGVHTAKSLPYEVEKRWPGEATGIHDEWSAFRVK